MLKKYTINEFLTELTCTINSSFNKVLLTGELTNLSPSKNEHWYFNLSDKEALISAVLFKSSVLKNQIIKHLNNGDKVICVGKCSIYRPRGTLQIIVDQIFHEGTGDQKIQYELLKQKLESEGIFNHKYKKKIPLIPKKIAIISSLNGAAIYDFINVFNRRSLSGELVLIDALMQGDSAALSVIEALNTVEHYNQKKINDTVDLVVITRGGGSFQDLFAFNDERLIRKVFEYKIPVISAIGHQIDQVLLDYVADLFTETPTAAAETITNYQAGIIEQLKTNYQKLKMHTSNKYLMLKTKLNNVSLLRQQNILLSQVSQAKTSINLQFSIMSLISKNRFNDLKNNLSNHSKLLQALSPNAILKQGFVYLKDNEQNKIIKNIKEFDDVSTGSSNIEINFFDGKRELGKR